MVWSSSHPVNYTEDSKVCTARPSEDRMLQVMSLPVICPAAEAAHMSFTFAVTDHWQGVGITFCPAWCSLERTLDVGVSREAQDFSEEC